MAKSVVIVHSVSVRFTCLCAGISENSFYYTSKLNHENAGIADWLMRLTDNKKCQGFELCFLYLRNVKDFKRNHNHEGLAIDVDLSLPSARVIRSLEQIIERRGKPHAIHCDNGPEYVSGELLNWAEKHQITLLHIQPSKPTHNAYIERYNRTVRHEWLGLHIFNSIQQAQELATKWLWTYNNERPNTAIGGVPPRQLLQVA